MHDEFWCVWSPSGRTPTVKHTTVDSAAMEATRLARLNGGVFYVLRAVGRAERSDVLWDWASGEAPIPF